MLKILGGPGAKTSATSGRGSWWPSLGPKPSKMAETMGGSPAVRSKSTKFSKYMAPWCKHQGSLRMAVAVFLNSVAVRALSGFFGATSSSVDCGTEATLSWRSTRSGDWARVEDETWDRACRNREQRPPPNVQRGGEGQGVCASIGAGTHCFTKSTTSRSCAILH